MAADQEDSTPEARYAALCELFFARGEATPSEKRGFGSSALTHDGRIFAMLTRGRLVVKLPKARVDALTAGGAGARFDANRGVPMKEWLVIDPSHAGDWAILAEEALVFARKKQAR